MADEANAIDMKTINQIRNNRQMIQRDHENQLPAIKIMIKFAWHSYRIAHNVFVSFFSIHSCSTLKVMSSHRFVMHCFEKIPTVCDMRWCFRSLCDRHSSTCGHFYSIYLYYFSIRSTDTFTAQFRIRNSHRPFYKRKNRLQSARSKVISLLYRIVSSSDWKATITIIILRLQHINSHSIHSPTHTYRCALQ